MISFICGILKYQTHRNNTDWWLPDSGSGGEKGEGNQKDQTCDDRINRSWRCDVQRGDCS